MTGSNDIEFRKWSKAGGASQGHVRFSEKVMFVSSSLLSNVRKDFDHFDVLVDDNKRLFALQFGKHGDFRVTRVPGQFGLSKFIASCKPVLNQRIHMKRVLDDGEHTTWTGSMDGAYA
jgi:hypothetical protein